MTGTERAFSWVRAGTRRSMIVCWLHDGTAGRWCVRLCAPELGDWNGYGDDHDEAASDALRQLTERRLSEQ